MTVLPAGSIPHVREYSSLSPTSKGAAKDGKQEDIRMKSVVKKV